MFADLLLTWLVFIAADPSSSGSAASPKDLAEGKRLYLAKCAKCHAFYEPRSYAEQEWREWMDKMARKSKLKPVQARQMNAYLDAYRAKEPPAK